MKYFLIAAILLVGANSKEEGSDFTPNTPAPAPEVCKGPGFVFPDPTDCDSFFVCNNLLQPIHYTCPFGEKFNPEINRCDSSGNVTCFTLSTGSLETTQPTISGTPTPSPTALPPPCKTDPTTPAPTEAPTPEPTTPEPTTPEPTTPPPTSPNPTISVTPTPKPSTLPPPCKTDPTTKPPTTVPTTVATTTSVPTSATTTPVVPVCVTPGQVIPDTRNCSIYYVCSPNLDFVALACPDELYWNAATAKCDYQSNVDCPANDLLKKLRREQEAYKSNHRVYYPRRNFANLTPKKYK